MELDVRLTILKDSGQLSEEDYIIIKNIISKIKEKFGIELFEENGSMFVTHMIMALKRIRTGEKVNPIEDLLKDEIENNENIQKVNEFIEIIDSMLNTKLPEDEKPFIKLHLCTLLESNK